MVWVQWESGGSAQKARDALLGEEQCHRQSGSHSSFLKDVVLQASHVASPWIQVDVALGPVPGT